jgi:hypothetical protein
MFRISFPTDNIYKMLSLLGLFVIVGSFTPEYHIHGLEIKKIHLTGEVKELEFREEWLSGDSSEYEKKVQYLEKYKQWEPNMIQALNPGTEEAKMYTEMTGNPIEPGIAEAVINLDSPEEIEKKKNEGIKELQSALDTANNKLRITQRELKESETKIKTGEKELRKTQQFLKCEKILAYIARVIGCCLFLIGSLKWRLITQKYEDIILKNQSD